jgi:hypothetical protein
MKFLSAYKLLESTGEYEIVAPTENRVDESIDEKIIVANVYIKHDTVKTADMSTKEGRRTYHMLHRSYGLSEADEKGTMMGGRTVGMFHKSGDVEVTRAWTWIDVKSIQEELSKYGIIVTEQHGQAKVTKDVDDAPVADWGHDGAYGENSNSVFYFTTTSERNWMIKFSGSGEVWRKFVDTFDSREYDSEEELIKNQLDLIIRNNIPSYPGSNSDDYQVEITFK